MSVFGVSNIFLRNYSGKVNFLQQRRSDFTRTEEARLENTARQLISMSKNMFKYARDHRIVMYDYPDGEKFHLSFLDDFIDKLKQKGLTVSDLEDMDRCATSVSVGIEIYMDKLLKDYPRDKKTNMRDPRIILYNWLVDISRNANSLAKTVRDKRIKRGECC
jgi:hypothetical protein